MEKGQMRCDVNLSLRRNGSKELGIRVEYKNLNSISGVRNAICHEISRQTRILDEGGAVRRETRRWDAKRNSSDGLREKEAEVDYCYFPDPDLMPVRLTVEVLTGIKNQLPEKPFDKQRRFIEQYKLPYTLTSVLCPNRMLADLFERTVSIHENANAIANLIVNDLLREISQSGTDEFNLRIFPDDLAAVVRSVDEGKFSKQAAQDILATMFRTGKKFDDVATSYISDICSVDIEELCRQAICSCEKAVSEFQNGKQTALNAVKGWVMKNSNGKANPAEISKVLFRMLQ
jgi:aspartyl-tRNA(Asn)/glutamyl-tRNA(Gln) amidotransferase subunit B